MLIAVPPVIQAGRWFSLLEGESAEDALAAVSAIADAIRNLPPRVVTGGKPDQMVEVVDRVSLAGGCAGLAILFAYLANAEILESASETAGRFLDNAQDAVAKVHTTPALYTGFTGVAWATAHLEGRLLASSGDDPNRELDAALQEYLAQTPWTNDYDLVNGLVGLGVYALERLPRPSAAEMLTHVVDRLNETAERTEHGAAWLTAPELLPAWQRERCPHGHYNLGPAHGIPGVIAVLGGACAARIAAGTARPLLDEAVRWLLAQRLPDDSPSHFPSWLGPGVDPAPSRSAWCYGDPGVAAPLLCAAQAVGESTWQREAITIAQKAAGRHADECGVRDAGFCHGAAGLGHLFNRMFQATGDERLGDAARFWLTRTLEMRDMKRGIGGFRTYFPTENGHEGWVNDPGILTGAAGIALALVAAISPIEPAWDRMMLLSLPSADANALRQEM